MFKKNFPFFAFLLIPLNQSSNWHYYTFDNIPANQVSHQKQSLSIEVSKSASPLLYIFPKEKSVTKISISAIANGTLPRFPKIAIQGSKAYDDFTLRLGLIIKGESRLNWLQRQMAPSWVTNMEKLLPDNKGIKKVLFFTTCQQQNLFHKKRTHFLNSRFEEECVKLIAQPGDISFAKKLEKPLQVLGLWIGSDGDQTSSQFQVQINKIQINYR